MGAMDEIVKETASLKPGMMQEVFTAHVALMALHIRALACHCECLGMNAENCQRASLGQSVAYPDEAYLSCMQKWGLITEKGEPKL